MNYDHPQLRERLCAEYALGTLRGGARRHFERLMARDGELSAQVAAWDERLAHMAWSSAPEARVPAGNWSAIQRRIQPAPNPHRPSLWNSLVFWRGLGVAASVLVVALLLTPGPQVPAPDAMPERVAMVVEPGSESTGWVITAAAGGQQIMARAIAPPTMPEGDVCVLWLVWPDGTVRAVGVLPEQGEMKLPVPAMDRQPYQAQVAVTIERSSNLPMSSPGGPRVYSGPWVQL
ncbi:MAG: anti-sigma factor domain-containing protein [Thioalkalivibrio sp.]